MSGTFELRAHTADVAVAATGETLDETFAAVADGLAAAMCDAADVPAHGDRFSLSVDAESRQAALFDYLGELIYERDVRGVLPVDNEATVAREGEAWTLSGRYRGVPLAAVEARDLKAVTYSEMRIEATDGGWSAYVVFDV